MKRTVKNWLVADLYKQRDRIVLPEYQREPNLWALEKKSLLIDSMLKDIDIPKLYFNTADDGSLEVIDGQQRLSAIFEYLDGAFAWRNEPLMAGEKTEEKQVRFSELSVSQRDKLKSYQLQITLLEDADEAYLRTLFVRLQLGFLLVTGEKLNAATGTMKSFIFNQMVKHSLIRALPGPERRFAKQTLCAQIAINSFSRAKNNEFARTRYEDLAPFFQEYENPQGADVALFKTRTEKIIATLTALENCLGKKAIAVLRNRSYVLSVYLFFEELWDESKLDDPKDQKVFADFVEELWKALRYEIGLGIKRKNSELYTFETLVSSAPGEKYQIKRRHDKLIEHYSYFKEEGRIKGYAAEKA